MPKITYISGDETPQIIEVAIGQSLMEGAIRNGIMGIIAECGGSCMCATCHLYIEGGPISALPVIDEEENVMLDETAGERRTNSRLGCQVKVNLELDGLVVRVAKN